MGIVVPLIAAILPIRRALGLSLNEALDVNRSRVAAVAVSIVRAGELRAKERCHQQKSSVTSKRALTPAKERCHQQKSRATVPF